jgi:hypothetical protein
VYGELLMLDLLILACGYLAPPPLEVQGHVSPRLRSIPHPVLDGQEAVLAALVHPDDDQKTQPRLLGPESGEYIPCAQA